MRLAVKVILILLAFSAMSFANGEWVLQSSTLTYHVSHPLHQVDGISHDARGKGVCKADQCDFLIAVPVKSFDSGDSNRDLHMLQVTRGGQFPLVTVRVRLPLTASTQTVIAADLEIQFAGQIQHYSQVPLQREPKEGLTRITGVVPATLSDFKIDPPSLLTVPIKNEIPIKVDMLWRS